MELAKFKAKVLKFYPDAKFIHDNFKWTAIITDNVVLTNARNSPEISLICGGIYAGRANDIEAAEVNDDECSSLPDEKQWNAIRYLLEGRIFDIDSELFSFLKENLEDDERQILNHLSDSWKLFQKLNGITMIDTSVYTSGIRNCQQIIALRILRRVYPEIWGNR